MKPLELEVKLYRLMSRMLMSMVDELSEEQMSIQLGQGNPPSWIIGHLALANDYGVATLGGTPQLIEKYRPLFGPGSPPTGDHPRKEQLIESFQESGSRFVDAIDKASTEQLQAERDAEVLKEQLPTVADMAGHLLTTHLSLHIGQLSAWRRAHGMSPVLQV